MIYPVNPGAGSLSWQLHSCLIQISSPADRGPPAPPAPGSVDPPSSQRRDQRLLIVSTTVHISPLESRSPLTSGQAGGGGGGVSDPDPRTLLTTRLIWDSAMAPGWAVQEELSSKREAMTRCCLNVGPASQTEDQHWDNIGSTSLVLVGYLSFTLNHWILNHLPSVDYNLNH